MKILLLALFVAAVTAVPLPEDNVGDAVEMIVNGVPEGQALEVSNIVDIKVKEHAAGELVSATDLLHPYTAVGIAEATAAAAAAAASDVLVVNDSEVIPAPVVLPEAATPEVTAPVGTIPEPVVLPAPVAPEVVPEAVVLPSPAVPEVIVPNPVVLPSPAVPEVVVPEAVVLPTPAVPEVVVPEAVVLPSPAVPEVVPEAVVLPSPAVPEVVVPEPVVLPSPVMPEVVPDVVVEPELLPNPAAQFPGGDLYNDGHVQVQYNGPEEPTMLSTLQSWFSMVLNYFKDGTQTSQQIV